MRLPFTEEQFYDVFRAYNTALWPAQLVLLGLALAALVLLLRPSRGSGVAISAILAFLWAWMGVAYHWAFFRAINPLAPAFAALSLGGALLFLWHGLIRRRLEFRRTGGARGTVGTALLLYSLVVYPAWSWLAGLRYPAMPTFGLPCSTTIFTLGILAFAVPPFPRSLLAVPILWCFVGAQAAFLLDVPQDLGLLLAGGAGLGLLGRPQADAQGGGAAQAPTGRRKGSKGSSRKG